VFHRRLAERDDDDVLTPWLLLDLNSRSSGA
jgi:hypothetical protein